MESTLERPVAQRGDWRLELEPERRRHLRVWLAAGMTLTFVILVIGGITRLTQSGLSIVEWAPIMGIVPPLSEAEWRAAFEQYQRFPEYTALRRGMTLEEFKFIFFWEYIHRLAARLIGLVFLAPFVFFWTRGYFNRPLLRRVLVLFGLGAAQGFMGWFMVRSGLVDDPRVSHYRLAAHLSIALAIFGYCLWLIRDLSTGTRARRLEPEPGRVATKRWVYALGAMLVLQILYGAFVAGLDAGLYFNTFPKMGDGLVPPGIAALDPLVANALENPVTVQWIHRVLGTVLLLALTLFVLTARRAAIDPRSVRLGRTMWALTVVQYGLGIATLLLFVPVSLGVLHQATAVAILAVWLLWLHHLRNEVSTA